MNPRSEEQIRADRITLHINALRKEVRDSQTDYDLQRVATKLLGGPVENGEGKEAS